MKRRILMVQCLIIAIFCILFVIFENGTEGQLSEGPVKKHIFPSLQSLASTASNLRFRMRGPQPVQNKIVIVDIDETSIEHLGRWPWPRSYLVELVGRVFELGAKTVAFDILFSEPQVSVPPMLRAQLANRGLSKLAEPFDDDALFEKLMILHGKNMVLTWQSEGHCVPRNASAEQCPVTHPDALAGHPEHFALFAAKQTNPDEFSPESTPIPSVYTAVGNLEAFETRAGRLGFANAVRDANGSVRRTALLFMVGNHAMPSLPMAIASAINNDTIDVEFDKTGGVEKLGFHHQDHPIPASSTAIASINFRGGRGSFPYISAMDILSSGKQRDLAQSTTTQLKGATAIIGVSALAVGDIVGTPFGSETPGVEVQATITDNLLSQDLLQSFTYKWGIGAFILMFIVVGLAIGIGLQLLNAQRSVLVAIATTGLLFGLDYYLFSQNIDSHFEFLYLLIVSLSTVTLLWKHVLEERQKQFLRDAFCKYVPPNVVNSIVDNPEKLSLGGRRENLTVLFSDIRGFSTISERMDAEHVSAFLNNYLDLMTDVVFSHQGTLDKYIGDAVMAFWGAPLPITNHPLMACEAAIDMAKTLANKRGELKDRFGVELRMGVGVHTGVVSVGNMGSSRTFDYTVLGDNVNLTSRLEGATKTFAVQALTTTATIEAIRALGEKPPVYRELGSIHVKGRDQAVDVVELQTDFLSEAGLNYFAKALEAFRKQDFKTAIELFERAQKILSDGTDDGPSKLYIRKCQQLIKEPGIKFDGSIF